MMEPHEEGNKPPSKKPKYNQTWKDMYSFTFKGIVKSDEGPSSAFCKFCRIHFSISHSGSYDIKKHVGRQKHKNAADAAGNSSLKDFATPDLSVIKSEVIFTKFLIMKNIPIAVADDAGDLFRSMFPKCKLAKDYACARTKATAIVHTLAKHEKNLTLHNLSQGGVFSLSTDGGNDTKQKLFPIIVRYANFEKEMVVDEILSVDSLDSVTASGRDIFLHVKKVVEDSGLLLCNCISFSVDNAAVMVGEKNGVAGQLHTVNDKINIIGCPCHRINLAALKAANALPYKIDQLLINIYFFLDKSTKRILRLKQLQEILGCDSHEILKHVNTRWLSLGPCVSRLLEQWEPLSALFLELSEDQESKTTQEKAQSVLRKLLSDEVKAYAYFIENVIPIFEKANATLQGDKPLIHKVGAILKSIINDICLRFMKPSFVKESDEASIDVHDKSGILSNDEIIVGQKCKKLVKVMKDDDKKRFYRSVIQYFQTAVDYFQKNCKLDNQAVVNASVADPSNKLTSTISSLNFFTDSFPSLLPVGMDNDDSVDCLNGEFRQWQASELEMMKDEAVDAYWFRMGKVESQSGGRRFAVLSRCMVGILSMFHSNAACERLFSLVRRNRTDFRGSMSNQLLESIAICKNNWGPKAFKDPLSKDLLTKAKSAAAKALADAAAAAAAAAAVAGPQQDAQQ